MPGALYPDLMPATRYAALVRPEGRGLFSVEFPDCLGCPWFCVAAADIAARARNTLGTWLREYDLTSLPRPTGLPHPAPPDGWVIVVELEE